MAESSGTSGLSLSIQILTIEQNVTKSAFIFFTFNLIKQYKTIKLNEKIYSQYHTSHDYLTGSVKKSIYDIRPSSFGENVHGKQSKYF